MIDVEFVTLGIIRCNIGDSVKCKIAFERIEGNRRLFDSSWCFMVSCWSFSRSGYLTIAIKTKHCY